MKRPSVYSWVEVSEKALLGNIRAFKHLLKPTTKLMAVVKSNAYGHGADLVARVAQKSKLVDWLGVASLQEALSLRRSDIYLPILVLSYFRPFIISDLKQAIKENISFIVYEVDQLKILTRAAQAIKRPARVHLKLETGMARLGLFTPAAQIFLKQILNNKYLELEGVVSHFATAEDKNQSFLNQQLKVFNKFIQDNKKILPSNILRHIACSAAISGAAGTHLDLVRLGISLYGLWPSLENKLLNQKKNSKQKLMPTLTWKTQIIEIQKLAKNIPVGYSRSFITKKPTIMATIPVGYWEGYDRKLSNRGEVLVGGKRCPIIGRICMNISMVDITSVKHAKVGDEVVLIGQQEKQQITADEVAQKVDTLNYEVVTRINPLLPRILVK